MVYFFFSLSSTTASGSDPFESKAIKKIKHTKNKIASRKRKREEEKKAIKKNNPDHQFNFFLLNTFEKRDRQKNKSVQGVDIRARSRSRGDEDEKKKHNDKKPMSVFNNASEWMNRIVFL